MENQLYVTIEAYIRKQMPSDEKKAFESRMASDPTLAADVAFYEALLIHHDRKAKAAWRAEGEAMLGISLTARPAPSLRRMQWAAAATLALLLTATGIWYTNFYNPYQSIVNEYYEPYKYSGSLGAAGSDQEDGRWRHALNAYRAEDYKDAIETAGQLQSSPRYADEARLLGAVISLDQHNPEEAIRLLEEVKTPSLREKVQFYTALAFLQDKKPEKAKTILDLIGPNSPYRAKADGILARLPKK